MCQYLVAAPVCVPSFYFQKLCILAPAVATFHSDIFHPFNICVFMWTSWLRSLRISTLWHQLISFSTVFVRCKLLYKLLELYKITTEIKYAFEYSFVILSHFYSVVSQIYLIGVFLPILPLLQSESRQGQSLSGCHLLLVQNLYKAHKHVSIIHIMCVKECQGGCSLSRSFPPNSSVVTDHRWSICTEEPIWYSPCKPGLIHYALALLYSFVSSPSLLEGPTFPGAPWVKWKILFELWLLICNNHKDYTCLAVEMSTNKNKMNALGWPLGIHAE